MPLFQFVRLAPEDLPSDALGAVPLPVAAPSAYFSERERRLICRTIVRGWTRALKLRDKETEGHARRVTLMTLALARQMGFERAALRHLQWGALLHDIGKIGVPDHILHKPGPLSEAERDVMRCHPLHACTLLKPIPFLEPALDIPLFHHERWDGDGYPHRLQGEAIPLSARIFAVVDVWDALRSPRPYRPAWRERRVRRHIAASAGSHFDPDVVAAFFRLQKQIRVNGWRERATREAPKSRTPNRAEWRSPSLRGAIPRDRS